MMDVSEMHERVTRMAVAAMLRQAGFERVDRACLHTLTQLAVTLMRQVSVRARLQCESVGRDQVCAYDAVVALVEQGVHVMQLPQYVRDTAAQSRLVVPPPKQSTAPAQPVALQVGSSSKPSYAPDYLPPLPDPHTFVRTQVSVESEPSYAQMRQSIAEQRLNAEQCLVNYSVKVLPSHQLFPESDQYRVLQLWLPSPSTVTAMLGWSANVRQPESAEDAGSKQQSLYLRPARLPNAAAANTSAGDARS